MNQEIQEFFENFIGYDGKTWDIKHAKKHGYEHSWFLYDMEKMIYNHVGYPSLLYLMNTVAYLGYCAKFDQSWKIPSDTTSEKKEFKNSGKLGHFTFFCDEYLKPIDEAYFKLENLLYELGRHKLSHIYFTNNAVTTDQSIKHLKIMDKGSNYPYIFISVKDFLEDTKKAIESLYQDLDKDIEKSNQFFEKQQFLVNQSWKYNRDLNDITLNNQNNNVPKSSGASGPHYPSNTGVSGIVTPYTPPQKPPESIDK